MMDAHSVTNTQYIHDEKHLYVTASSAKTVITVVEPVLPYTPALSTCLYQQRFSSLHILFQTEKCFQGFSSTLTSPRKKTASCRYSLVLSLPTKVINLSPSSQHHNRSNSCSRLEARYTQCAVTRCWQPSSLPLWALRPVRPMSVTAHGKPGV